MSKREKAEYGIMQLIMLLLVLILASFWMLGNLYARYTTKVSGEAEARVAGFHILMKAADGTTLPAGIGIGAVAGDQTIKEIPFTVSGDSEVALNYTLEVELTHADQTELTAEEWEQIKPQIVDVSSSAGGSAGAGSGTVTPVIGAAGTMAGGKGKTCTYTFDSLSENVAPTTAYKKDYKLQFSETPTLENFKEGFQVKIFIDGKQID